VTAKAEIAKLRRCYFACCHTLGLDEDTRHAFNDSFIGLRSTRKWSLTNWRTAVAELQRTCGLEGVEAGQPHLRRMTNDESPMTDTGDWATAAQVWRIERLAEQIHWRAAGGLQLWIRKRMLAASPTMSTNWSGKLKELPRETASHIITGLRRWAAYAA